MATTFYFPQTGNSDVTPPAPVGSTTWEHINPSLPILAMVRTPDSSTLTTTAYAPDAADDLTDKDSCHRQYVSEPLAAQTFSGNVTGQFQCFEELANCNLFLSMKIYLVTSAGALRTGLLNITRSTASEANTSIRNLTFPSTALIASQSSLINDRLVIEIGLGGSITSGTGGVVGHNGSLRFGCNASSGDLPVDNTTTTATFRPWVQFSGTISFSSGPITVTPGVATLTLATFAPAVATPQAVMPDATALTLATFAPTVMALQGLIVTPDTATLSLNVFLPTVTVSTNQWITPETLGITTVCYAPTVTVTNHQFMTPETLALALTTFAPTVEAIGSTVLRVRHVPAIMSARRRRKKRRVY